MIGSERLAADLSALLQHDELPATTGRRLASAWAISALRARIVACVEPNPPPDCRFLVIHSTALSLGLQTRAALARPARLVPSFRPPARARRYG